MTFERATRRRLLSSTVAAGAITALASANLALPASADEGDYSRAEARFLSGEVLGVDLDDIVELAGVEVENFGTPEPVTDANPLTVEILNAIELDVPGGIQLPLSDIIELGAVNQWATAEDKATSSAATGAVADNGGVGTGVEDGFPGNANFDLTNLLGDELTDLIADVELELGAISSEAHLIGPSSEGDVFGTGNDSDEFQLHRDYEIAGGFLKVQVPALADLGPEILDASGSVDELLNSVLSEGSLLSALGNLLGGLSLPGVLELNVDVLIPAVGPGR
jgi:hypothetical protein